MDERSTSPASGASEEERRRREEALRALADTSVRAKGRAAAGAMRDGREKRRRWVGLVSALLVVTLVASGALYLHSRTSAKQVALPKPTGQLIINFAAHNLVCPSGAAWSPDGTRLAVMVINNPLIHDCMADARAVAIFDGQTGDEVTVLDPTTVRKDFRGTGHFVWTPDGKAVAFDGGFLSTDSFTPAVALLPVNGGTPRLITGNPLAIGPSQFIRYRVWDMRQGTVAQSSNTAQPPALTYRWTPDGRIVADQPLPTSSNGMPYSGSPVASDGASFSLWGNGIITAIQYLPCTNCSGQPKLAGLAYGADVSRWSPDGRYLAFGLSLSTWLPPADGKSLPKHDRATCEQEQFFSSIGINCNECVITCQAKPAAYPDAALAAIKRAADVGVHAYWPNGTFCCIRWGDVPAVWAPDGARVATLLPDDGFAQEPKDQSSETLRVSIYRADGGTPIARLTASWPNPQAASSSPSDPLDPFLYWSPDGKALALLDTWSNQVTIWSAPLLPA